jgi:CRP-like cAMP-binding protein
VEQYLQLETYATALTEALLRAAGETEIDALRRSFGVGVEDHQALRARLRSGSEQLVERAQRELAEIRTRRDDRAAVAGATAAGESRGLLAFLLGRAEERAQERFRDLLALLGETEAAALRAELDEMPRTVGATEETLDERLSRLAVDADPYLRAAAVWALVSTGSAGAASTLAAARRDGDPLVREAAEALANSERFAASPRIARMQALRGIPLFAELDPDDLLDAVELAREETVPADGVLCRQGDVDAGDLFVILDGRAAVSVRAATAEGEREREIAEREIADLGPGEVVGELALLDGSPRSATVRPRGGPLRVLRIEAAAFRDRLLPRGRVARSLLLTLTERLRRLSGKLAAPGPTPRPPGA